MMRSRAWAIAAALAVGAALLGGCTVDTPSRSTPAAPSPTTTWGPVRHETAPFTKHFPGLRMPKTASWVKGSYGTPSGSRIDLPSPPSTKLDVIVEVDPAVADKLHAMFGHAGKVQQDDGTWVDDPDVDPAEPKIPPTPEVAPALQPSLPDGSWLSGRDNLGTTYGWTCTVYVHRTKPVVVVQAFLPWATGFGD